MNISNDARKRLLQSGFLAGLKFLGYKHEEYKYSFVKELPEDELKEIEQALGDLFSEYGLSGEVV